jgi:hypothetical protein
MNIAAHVEFTTIIYFVLDLFMGSRLESGHDLHSNQNWVGSACQTRGDHHYRPVIFAPGRRDVHSSGLWPGISSLPGNVDRTHALLRDLQHGLKGSRNSPVKAHPQLEGSGRRAGAVSAWLGASLAVRPRRDKVPSISYQAHAA